MAEVEHRLEGYYGPYHEALSSLVQRTQQEFGVVWHLDCHSWTPPRTGREGRPVNHVDFSLGNRDGATCDADFTAFVAQRLRDMGYEVRVNRPFKGMEVVRRYGSPEHGRHSLQVEINRNLYMDKHDYRKLAGFSILQANLSRLVADICDYAHRRR